MSDTSPCYSTRFVDWELWNSDISFPSLQWPVFIPIPETLFLLLWCVAWHSELWFFWFHKAFFIWKGYQTIFLFAVFTHECAIRMGAGQDSGACGQGSVWAGNGNLRWQRNLNMKMLRKRNGTHSFLLLSDSIKGKNGNLFTVFSDFTEVRTLLWISFLSLGNDMA